LANKEVAKPLEHNPFAMVGKIKEAVMKMKT